MGHVSGCVKFIEFNPANMPFGRASEHEEKGRGRGQGT